MSLQGFRKKHNKNRKVCWLCQADLNKPTQSYNLNLILNTKKSIDALKQYQYQPIKEDGYTILELDKSKKIDIRECIVTIF